MDLFQEATEHHTNGRFAEAEKLYDMLLSQNHDNAGLMATLGTLYLQTGKYGHAVHFLEAAHRNKLIQSDVLSNLSLAYKNSGQQEKARDYIEKACQVADPCAGALANYSGFFTNCGTPEKALELCDKAIEKEPELIVAHWNRALALLEMAEWEKGWEEHEWGLKPAKHVSAMRVDRKIGDIPTWDGTPGKTVMITGEQGLGDEIMFASMIPDVKSVGNVIIECHKRLVTLFEKSFNVPCFGTREDTSISWPFDYKIDYRIQSGSLGKFFRRSKDSFPGTPFLKADPVEKGKKFRVGISWTGGAKAGRIKTRTVPLSWWQPILEQDCEFVSLQYTDQGEEIATIENLGHEIKQYDFMTDRTLDYYETAKVVASCDLVISSCTSVIHLAGALGVPCWVLVPNKPAWRYGVKGPMPWYRSVRLYRQNQNDSWLPVIHKVAEDLYNLRRNGASLPCIKAA
jgi:hypothetical protein